MKVLIACEYSGIVRDAFNAAGHDAMSCDLLPTEKPGPHYVGNVMDVIYRDWDLMIAHPPCTYLCSSGIHWNNRVEGRNAKTDSAAEFFMTMFRAPIPRICIENPVGVMSSRFRPPDQYIQPYEYGHDASKKTGLWLRGLPKLKPTSFVEPRLVCCGKVLNVDLLGKYGCPHCEGSKKPAKRWANQTNSGQNALGPSAGRWKERAKTYQGIANAMAGQWT